MATIWLVHVEKFHRHVLRCLGEHGIEVEYVCATPERLENLNAASPCILHSVWDAMAARLPTRQIEGNPKRAPRAQVLEELAQYETTALLMIDRMNGMGLRVQDLRRVYFDYISMWEVLLGVSRPNAVVFHSIPHMGYDYVLYLLCRRLGISTLIVERTSIPDRLIMIRQLDDRPGLAIEPLESAPPSSAKVPKQSHDYYEARNRSFQVDPRRSFSRFDVVRNGIRSSVFLAYQIVKRPIRIFKPAFASMHGLEAEMPSDLRHQWRYFKDSIRMSLLRLYYEKHAVEPDLSANYVYFPLHTQPERSSLPMGLLFSDQLLALKIVAEALPSGWSIYVKEHPRQFTDNPMKSALGRNRRFYDLLFQQERVKVVAPRVPSEKLLENSRCAVTIAGSVSWEAVQRGVPSIIFGAPWYRFCPGVERASSVAECAKIFRRIDAGEYHIDPVSLQAYIDWISTDGGFHGYFADIFAAGSGLSPEQNGRAYADKIAHELRSPGYSVSADIRVTSER